MGGDEVRHLALPPFRGLATMGPTGDRCKLDLFNVLAFIGALEGGFYSLP